MKTAKLSPGHNQKQIEKCDKNIEALNQSIREARVLLDWYKKKKHAHETDQENNERFFN